MFASYCGSVRQRLVARSVKLTGSNHVRNVFVRTNSRYNSSLSQKSNTNGSGNKHNNHKHNKHNNMPLWAPVLMCCASLLGGAGLCASTQGDGRGEAEDSEEEEEGVPLVTMEEVARHNTPEDCWVVMDGKVYDVTSFLSYHPGGGGILRSFAGGDASKEFEWLQHSDNARVMRSGLHIANVRDYVRPVPALERTDNEAKAGEGVRSDGDDNAKDDNDNTEAKDVVIVGAGIVGVAAAYHLAKKGHRVTVLEQGPMVGGTALYSSAILYLGPLLERDDSKAEHSATAKTGDEACDMLLHMHTEWEDIEFERRNVLGVIQTEEQRALVTRLYGEGGRLQGKGKILDPVELLEVEPALNPSLLGGVLSAGATCDPYLTCNAFAKRAKRHGARFLFNHSVTSLERRDDGGFNVVCGDENGQTRVVKGDTVALCVGWAARSLAGQLGHEALVPVSGMHGQMFATHHPTLTLNNMLYSFEGPAYWSASRDRRRATLTSDEPYERLTRHLYGNQIANGVLKFGGDRVVTTRFLDEPIESGIQASFEHICEVVPCVRECEIVGSWGGVMPFTPDQKLILGRLEEGLYVATGAAFTKGPIAGLLLAESVDPSITTSHEHANQLREYSPQRFEK